MLFNPEQFSKLDETEDKLFYQSPRFVTHVDDRFIRQLTTLYREMLSSEMRVIDLMSSWVSHLPEDQEYAWVEGHGMNTAELARNPRLNHFFVQNLNTDPYLPFADCEFDALLNTVSVQYLQQPAIVFAEIARILKPGGVAIVSFSNRMFYQKAIQVWREGTDASHIELVKNYFRSTLKFKEPESFSREGRAVNWLDALRGEEGTDPFFAVTAFKL